ncbi:MAG: DUF2281 domain-containing protein [Candidatus Hydrogenedentes bacterium]|nr:DUF2281 domain-containing protein [Candidatus Hydrogenedentota bacterium]
MTLPELLCEKVKTLPPEKQKEVLDFVESLAVHSGSSSPCHSIEGLWADLDVELSANDIEEARRELWGAFPREGIS